MQTKQDRWTYSHEQHIASDAMAGKRCIDQLLSKLEEMQWIEQDIFGVHLAFEEAVVNATKPETNEKTDTDLYSVGNKLAVYSVDSR